VISERAQHVGKPSIKERSGAALGQFYRLQSALNFSLTKHNLRATFVPAQARLRAEGLGHEAYCRCKQHNSLVRMR